MDYCSCRSGRSLASPPPYFCPLEGKINKFFVLFSGLESSYNFLVIFSILLSVVSAFYYIRFIKIIFFDAEKIGLIHVNRIGYMHSLILGSTLFFITFFFIYPNGLYLLTQYIILNFFC